MMSNLAMQEEWIPRADYEELRAQYHEVREQRDFILQVIAVPDSVMQASDKITNIVVDNELRNRAVNEKGFVPVNMKEVARLTGLGYGTVLDCKKQLTEKMGLYEQDTLSFYHQDDSGKVTSTKAIALKPTQAQSYPRLYDSPTPIIRGGNEAVLRGKERKGKPTCPACGSENVDLYQSHICHDCHSSGHKEISLAPVSPAPLSLSIEQEPIEHAQAEERATVCQLGTVITTTEGVCQVGTTPHEEPVMSEKVCKRCGDIPTWVLTPLGQKVCSCSQYSREQLKAQRRARQPALLL